MVEYFPEELELSTRDHEKAVRNEDFYKPVLDFLYKREEEFRTEDVVEEADHKDYPYFDVRRASTVLGVFREEYGLIDGDFDFGDGEGNYYWDPELQAEGTWKDVRQELKEINRDGSKRPKVQQD